MDKEEKYSLKTLKRKKERELSIYRERWEYGLYKIIKRANRVKYKTQTDFDRNYILELYKKQKGKCYWFGVDLVIGEIKHPLKPSIDRKDTNKGYTRDNIILTSLFANLARNHNSMEDWIKILRKIGINYKITK